MSTGNAVIARKLKSGTSWQIRWRDSSGELRHETLGSSKEGWSRRKAEAQLNKRTVAVADKRDKRKVERVLLSQLAAEWLGAMEGAGELKFSTQRSYRGIVTKKVLPAFGHLEPREVRPALISEWKRTLSRKGAMPGTVNRALNCLSLLMVEAKERELIEMNPVASVRRPVEREVHLVPYGAPEVAAVDAAFGELIRECEDEQERDDLQVVRALFVLHMGTGLRRGESAGLRWRHLRLADPERAPSLVVEETWARGRLGSPKSKAGRRAIALPARVVEVLVEHLGWTAYSSDDDFVLPNPRSGRPFDDNRMSALMKKAMRRAGVHVLARPTHDLRHSFLTAAGRSMKGPALMALAGHSSYATTRRYVHINETHEEEMQVVGASIFGASEPAVA